jgi:hypothetical protein
VTGLDLEEQLDQSLSRSVRKRGRVSLGLNLDHPNVEDTVAIFEKRFRQKAILEEGTYFSLLGNHVCNIESDLDIFEQPKETPEDIGEWHVIVDTTDGASGVWLRKKFNLVDEGRHEANFSGAVREAKITASDNTSLEEEWSTDVGLVVLECGSDLKR